MKQFTVEDVRALLKKHPVNKKLADEIITTLRPDEYGNISTEEYLERLNAINHHEDMRKVLLPILEKHRKEREERKAKNRKDGTI